jgi:hypothetical protein
MVLVFCVVGIIVLKQIHIIRMFDAMFQHLDTSPGCLVGARLYAPVFIYGIRGYF